MDPAVIKGLFDLGSGLVSAGGSLWSSSRNRQAQESENARNRQLAREQNRWNLEQWQRENVYNSPLAQMERLRAAGINPAMAYSDGIENLAAQSPNMVSSQGSAYTGATNPFSGFADTVHNAQLIDSQIKLNESQAAKNNADAALKSSLTKYTNIKMDISKWEFDNLSETQKKVLERNYELLGKTLEQVDSTISNINADTSKKLLEGDELKYRIEKILPAELDKLQSEANLNKAQAYEVISFIASKIALNEALAKQAISQSRYNDAMSEFQDKLNSSDTYVQGYVNNITLKNGKLQADIDRIYGENPGAANISQGRGDDIQVYSGFLQGANIVCSVLGKILHFSN